MPKFIRLLSESGATLALATLNIAFYVAATTGWISADFLLGSDWQQTAACPWTLASYMAIHAEAPHLITNTVVLLLFGAYYEHRTSPMRMLAAYLSGGLLGGIFFAATAAFSVNTSASLSGASAAVIAVACAASCDRRSTFRFWGLPSQWIIFYLAISSISELFGANPGGGIAHIGGIIAGLTIGLAANRTSISDKSLSNLVDKANQSGFAALSKEERALFFNQNSTKR